MKDLFQEYRKRKNEIKDRLKDFEGGYKKSNEYIWRELCFCLLTPQAKALMCDRALKELGRRNLLLVGTDKDIRPYLSGVRFPNNKARYLILARKVFSKNNSGIIDIKSKLDIKDIFKTRDWLVENVIGLGYKETSHFLRNIGLGKDLAILDRHILRNLKRYGVIRKVPALSRKNYIEIENRIKKFSKKINIPIDEIDLLFWAKETGLVFK